MDSPDDFQYGYKVDLEAFNGPLDLLLYLIRQNEVDVADIPIAAITDQYLEHLHALEQVNVNLAGEFLVMAATLMEIKSRMLLPAHDEGDGEEDEDPRADLIRQLIEYKRFRDAARSLARRADKQALKFTRGAAAALALPERPAQDDLPILIGDVTVWDLLAAFKTILRQTSLADHHIVLDSRPMAEHCQDLLDRLRRRGTATFRELFEPAESRQAIISLFLALLELIRERQLRAEQAAHGGEIRLFLVDAGAPPEPVPARGPAATPPDAQAHGQPAAESPPVERLPRKPGLYTPLVPDGHPSSADELARVAQAIDSLQIPDIQLELSPVPEQPAAGEPAPAIAQPRPATPPRTAPAQHGPPPQQPPARAQLPAAPPSPRPVLRGTSLLGRIPRPPRPARRPFVGLALPRRPPQAAPFVACAAHAAAAPESPIPRAPAPLAALPEAPPRRRRHRPSSLLPRLLARNDRPAHLTVGLATRARRPARPSRVVVETSAPLAPRGPALVPRPRRRRAPRRPAAAGIARRPRPRARPLPLPSVEPPPAERPEPSARPSRRPRRPAILPRRRRAERGRRRSVEIVARRRPPPRRRLPRTPRVARRQPTCPRAVARRRRQRPSSLLGLRGRRRGQPRRRTVGVVLARCRVLRRLLTAHVVPLVMSRGSSKIAVELLRRPTPLLARLWRVITRPFACLARLCRRILNVVLRRN